MTFPFSFWNSVATDPLAGIPLSRRWQAHNFQSGTPQQTVTAAGAEFDEINGGYLLVADTWTMGNGATITYDAGTSIWTISNAAQSGGYIGTGGDASNPATATQWFQTGIATDPEPVVTTQLSPFYLPFGLFQDAACTTSSLLWGDPIGGWKDMFTVGNPVASQSNAMQRPLLQFAPNGSGVWIPVPVFNGVDDGLIPSQHLRFNQHTICVTVSLASSQTQRVFVSEYAHSQCYFAVGISDNATNRAKYYTAPPDTTLEPAGSDLVVGVYDVLSWSQDSTPTKSYWKNGSLIGTQAGTSTSNTTTGSGIGFLGGLNIQYANVKLPVVFVSNPNLSDADRIKVQNYAANFKAA